MNFEKLEERDLFKHIWISITMEAGTTIAINVILEQVEEMGAKRFLIDSITALRQQFKDSIEARILLQTLLSKIIKNLKCTAILIKESGLLKGPLDFEEYIADADIHLKITREHGCTLLYGIKPRTPLYAIQLKPDKTPPIPDLIRIT